LFGSIIEKLTKVKTIKGSLTGTKNTSTDGTFDITFLSYPSDGSAPSTSIFAGQKYIYDKSKCTLAYTFYKPTDGSKGVIDYLDKYHISLNPEAILVTNNGIRLSGNFSGVIHIPILVTAYPGKL
jgi:hypothetical protein